MDDLALLIIRLVGALVAGHGARTLFLRFRASNPRGTTGFSPGIGLRPARLWVVLVALIEFGSGTLTLLGLLYPLAPIGILIAMAVTIAAAQWGTSIGADHGGAELPLTNAAVATALLLAGPGGYAPNQELRIWLFHYVAFGVIPLLAFVAAVVAVAFAVAWSASRIQRALRDPGTD